MNHKVVCVTILAAGLLITAAGIAWAQPGSGFNEPVPGCQSNEILNLFILEDPFIVRFTALSEAYDTLSSTDPVQRAADARALLADANALQTDWTADGAPNVPRCAFAIEHGAILGRMFDEALLITLFTSLDPAAYRAEIRQHSDRLTGAQDDLAEIGQAMQTWIDEHQEEE